MEKETVNIDFDKAFDEPISIPSWCKSEAAQFIWVKAQEYIYKRDGSVDRDKMCFIKAALHDVTDDELEKLTESFEMPTPVITSSKYKISRKKEGVHEMKKNETIDELIKALYDDDVYPAIGARDELKERFSEQSYQDQVRIIRALLKSNDESDRIWCGFTMRIMWEDSQGIWWNDEVIPDVQTAWESFHDAQIGTVVAQRCPIEYVIAQRDSLEAADYASVCMRLAKYEDYKEGDSELTRKEFLSIAVNKHWPIDDDEADELLFGFILDKLKNPEAAYTYYGFESNIHYPTLNRINDMDFYIEALGKLGKIKTLEKLFDWNEQLKLMMAEYISDPKHHSELTGWINEGISAFQYWMWDRFMALVKNSFPFDIKTFRETHNKYHFKKEPIESYHGFFFE